MSIIAGIYSRQPKTLISDRICREIESLISRNANDQRVVFKNERACFVKIDIGAIDEKVSYEKSLEKFSVAAGEPLLPGNQNKEKDLLQIRRELSGANFSVLTETRGAFCLADYQDQRLTLATDKLGIRPLYYWIGEEYIVFASALRVLENLPLIPKKMNVRAVTEIAGLGYALNNRTPYQDIFLLNAGEILQVKNETISATKYWDWGQIKISAESEEQLLAKLYEDFAEAVRLRLRSDRATIAYLSGGLDSRCIVAMLRELEAKVYTFNFARPNTQDQILGRSFAEKSGVVHTEVPKEAGDHVPDYSTKMAEAWKKSSFSKSSAPERPNLVWSGEGGSVALGHVHLPEKIVELMRAGKKDEAIEYFLQREHIYLSPKLYKRNVLADISEIIHQGISEELKSIETSDPARQFYLFLLLNDQRRKLASHFENMDLHRLEFQLPFFDSEFLQTIISTPVDLCLRHQFYVKWLYLFPASVTSVSWQAYPGHEPCPLPIPEGLSYQWDGEYQTNEQKSLKRKLVNQGKEILSANDFPSDILSRTNIRLALWLHQIGWRDYSYIIENAAVYHRYWKICGGSYQL